MQFELVYYTQHQFKMHGINNVKMINAQCARIFHKYKNTKEKLLKKLQPFHTPLPPVQQPIVLQSCLILEILRLHTVIHHSWYDSSGRVINPSQEPLPNKAQHSQKTDIHVPGGIHTHNTSKRAVTDPHLRPLGLWDQQCSHMVQQNMQE